MQQIGVGDFQVTQKQRRYVNHVLDSNRLSYGPYSRRFESLFAQLHSVKYAAFCNSGTSALRVAIATLKEVHGWQDGDEILLPAVTFIACANVIIDHNLTPIFVDVESDYYGINPALIEEKITPRTKAIMVVHLFGMPCHMDPIVDIAKKHDLRIIEDSCETMFATYKGKSVGSFGDISCFSTYMAHIIVTGVGGLACTSNENYAEILRSLLNHGRDSIYLSIDDDKNKSKEELKKIVNRRFRFVRPGYSFRCTELEAALGLAQLEDKDEMMSKRIANGWYLIDGLKSIIEIQLPKIRDGATHSFMMFPIVVKNDTKVALVNFLEENNIETRDMLPLINQPIYTKLYGNLEENYPVAKTINDSGFYIGCHPGVNKENMNYIIQKFKEFFSNGHLNNNSHV